MGTTPQGPVGHRSRAAAALALTALLAAGCSDPAGSPEGDSGTSGLSGPPVKLVAIADEHNRADSEVGVRAAVRSVNARGGIAGRPLQVTVCANQDNANLAAKCARDAAADPDVVGLAGTQNNFGSATNPVLEEAGLSTVGIPLTASDFTSEAFYAVVGGNVVALYSQLDVLVEEAGARRLTVAYLDIPAGRQLPPLVASYLRARGLPAARTVAVPPSAVDVSAQAAEALRDDPEGVALLLTTDMSSRFLQAVRQQGATAPVSVPGSSFSAEVAAAQLAGSSGDLYVGGQACHGDPGYQGFRSDAAAVGEDRPEDAALYSYMAVRVLAQVAREAPHADRAAITGRLRATRRVDGLGVVPDDLDFTREATVMGGDYPRMFNSSGCAFRWQDGSLTQLGGFRSGLFG
ncbi:hypothetical protein PZ61_0235670 [Streptomyces sp. MNU77]|uniref:ABC transporter substrate-binding protein n=1 Tax=Streptomyces sp. MNU77 TaxID=1573406 RepID=UPI0005EA30FE|nr:ABC transporter substrate-binding protein [Streptomyces sp. MNU77]OLO25779.1 hypothetical protein PZ61_0235670 [Streptomyces sp. MNU77]